MNSVTNYIDTIIAFSMYYRSFLYVLTTHVTVCVCHTEIKGYLLTYLFHNLKQGYAWPDGYWLNSRERDSEIANPNLSITLAAILTRRVTLLSSGDWFMKPETTLWRTPGTSAHQSIVVVTELALLFLDEGILHLTENIKLESCRQKTKPLHKTI